MKALTKYEMVTEPKVKVILEKCREDIEALTNTPVSVFYRIKFHHLPSSELIRIVCNACEVSWEQIISESRKAHIVIARHLFCWFALSIQKKSLTEIGRSINKDHTSVLHAREKVRNMRDTNDELWMIPFLEIESKIDELITASIHQGAKEQTA